MTSTTARIADAVIGSDSTSGSASGAGSGIASGATADTTADTTSHAAAGAVPVESTMVAGMDSPTGRPRSSHARYRFAILALATFSTLLTTTDRAALSVSAPAIALEFAIDPALLGVLFSAFSLAYVCSQIPAGIFLDKVGARIGYTLGLTCWTAFALLQTCAGGAKGMAGARMLLGLAESQGVPACNRVVCSWFPREQRGRATSVFLLGQYIAIGCLAPLLCWTLELWGWRRLFHILAACAACFTVVWWLVCRNAPDAGASRANEQAEVGSPFDAKAEADVTAGRTQKRTPFAWRDIGCIVRHRQFAGMCIGQLFANATFVFFVSWFPTYLSKVHGLQLADKPLLAAMPFLGGAAGAFVAGNLSDWLLKATGSVTFARKAPIVGGLLLASTLVGANWITDHTLLMALLTLSFFGQGMITIAWSVVSDLSPKHMLGLTSGIFNGTDIAGFLTPIVMGLLISRTGGFDLALGYVSLCSVIAAACYLFVVGKIAPLDIRPAASAVRTA